MTISLKPDTGPVEFHLVQSVTFHPFSGLMDITTRYPDALTITTGA